MSDINDDIHLQPQWTAYFEACDKQQLGSKQWEALPPGVQSSMLKETAKLARRARISTLIRDRQMEKDLKIWLWNHPLATTKQVMRQCGGDEDHALQILSYIGASADTVDGQERFFQAREFDEIANNDRFLEQRILWVLKIFDRPALLSSIARYVCASHEIVEKALTIMSVDESINRVSRDGTVTYEICARRRKKSAKKLSRDKALADKQERFDSMSKKKATTKKSRKSCKAARPK